MPYRIIIAITGATGAIYGIKLLQLIKDLPEVESHLIISRGGQITLAKETSFTYEEVISLAHHHHSYQNIAASLASGSFKRNAMIIAPCSMKSLAEIAHGWGNNLVSRAADVTLKERRKLILMVRETPLNLSHLHNMVRATEMGAIITPPVNSFYIKPETIEDLVHYTAIRILDLLDFDLEAIKRWKG